MIGLYTVNIGGFKIGVHFSFLALVSLITLLNGEFRIKLYICLGCCILHELGHLTAMAALGVRPRALVFYGGGILIKKPPGSFTSSLSECVILLSGPAANAMTAIISAVFGCKSVVGYSVFCAVFNLLPFSYFDGWRVLDILLPSCRVQFIIRQLLIIILFLLVIFVSFCSGLNVSLVITFVYIVFCEISALQ